MTSPVETSGRRFSVEQVMAIASAVLLPLGLIMILLGWYGAAHTPYLFEQVPYLISGGILGLGFALVGGLVYFGSWLARGAAEQQRRTEEMSELLREIRDEMRSGSLAAPAPTRRTRSSSNGQRDGAAPFVATARGGMLHRPDCAVVAGREDLRPIGAGGDGLSPCTLCNPFDADVLTS
jgi:hypothetical protein